MPPRRRKNNKGTGPSAASGSLSRQPSADVSKPAAPSKGNSEMKAAAQFGANRAEEHGDDNKSSSHEHAEEPPDPELLAWIEMKKIVKAKTTIAYGSPRVITEVGRLKAFAPEADMQLWAEHAFMEESQYYLHKSEWEALSVQIFKYSSIVFPRKCMWRLIDDTTKAQLFAVTPRAAEFSEDPNDQGCYHLFHAWIWHILYKNLFSPDCLEKWSGVNWAAFGTLQKSLGENMKNESNALTDTYHNGRHHMARVLYLRDGPHTSADRLKRIIKKAIKPISSLAEHKDNHVAIPGIPEPTKLDRLKARINSEDILDELIRLAIEADFCILASPYDTRIEMNDPETGKNNGFIFEPGPMMQGHEPGEEVHRGLPVDFIVRPMLRTYGQYTWLKLPTDDDPNYVYRLSHDFGHCHAIKPMAVLVNHFCRSDKRPKARSEHAAEGDTTSVDMPSPTDGGVGRAAGQSAPSIDDLKPAVESAIEKTEDTAQSMPPADEPETTAKDEKSTPSVDELETTKDTSQSVLSVDKHETTVKKTKNVAKVPEDSPNPKPTPRRGKRTRNTTSRN